MGNDLVVENEEQRRDQHGQGHDQQHEIGQGAVDDEIGERKGNQHEGEFAGLWKAEAEEPERLFAQAVKPPDSSQHDELRSDDDCCPEHDFLPYLRSKVEIDASADGDEEEAQQQALDRIDIAFQFVPIFAGRKNDTRHEGAERRGEAHKRHQQGDADHDQQGSAGEQLTQAGGGNETEQGADRVDADDHHCGDRADAGDGGEPHRHGGGEVNSVMRACTDRAATRRIEIGHGQQRQESEDGNDRDVLNQQDREACFTAFGAHEFLLGQRLDDDRSRRQG